MVVGEGQDESERREGNGGGTGKRAKSRGSRRGGAVAREDVVVMRRQLASHTTNEKFAQCPDAFDHCLTAGVLQSTRQEVEEKFEACAVPVSKKLMISRTSHADRSLAAPG